MDDLNQLQNQLNNYLTKDDEITSALNKGNDLEHLSKVVEDFSREISQEEMKIVIVEDDKILAKTICKYIQRKLPISVSVFNSGDDFLSNLSTLKNVKKFCLITDISLEKGPDGLLLIDLLKEQNLNFVAIAVTGFASIENAIRATKKGVFHYLTKPFELENLVSLVQSAFKEVLKVDISSLGSVNNQSIGKKDEFNDHIEFGSNTSKLIKQKLIKKIDIPKISENDMSYGMVGRSHKMKMLFERIRKVSNSNATVLIQGPSGTGKELIAQAIHYLSNRRKHQLISVNCGAIPNELLESELFGHMKGSFTGAVSDRKGRFELGDKGSIFLDEIGDMPIMLQVKLLRVLQNRQIEVIGSSKSIDIDTRVITATHKDLDKAVQDKSFREDLYYRLNVVPIKVPSLKERIEDIPLLISYFLSKFVSHDQSNMINFDEKALELIMSYDWPGNVRELENLIQRSVILRGGNTITPEDLPAKIYRNNILASQMYSNIFELPEEGLDLKKTISEIEDSLITQALRKTSGNKNQASKLLKLNRTTLIEKLKKKSVNINL
jgi:two-component system, NtrC family, response regulator PilR